MEDADFSDHRKQQHREKTREMIDQPAHGFAKLTRCVEIEN
jgi:hypothetical protein